MTTVDEIMMQADADDIFQVAVNVEFWPEILPHYRWVRILERRADGLVVEMSARRGSIPVKWVAIQTVDRAQRKIMYRHIGGATKGMNVVWRVHPLGEGVHVSIVHELRLQHPLVRTFLGKTIVGSVFVKYIAGETLRWMKAALEGGREHTCAVQSSLELGQ
ncbi:MAG TPA: SRPBCC family protein [Armatimonadota bacterium]|jgi:ribosome-associated toxin RatA of RatAB toxin-antitoxin module